MKQLKQILKKIIYPTCTVSTVIASLFLLIIFSTETAFAQPGLTPQGYGLILLWSFFFVCTCQIFRMKLHIAARVLIHFLICTATFVICFIFLGGYYADKGASSLYITFAFILVYFLIAIPILLIKRHLQTKKNDAQKYRSMLTKSKS